MAGIRFQTNFHLWPSQNHNWTFPYFLVKNFTGLHFYSEEKSMYAKLLKYKSFRKCYCLAITAISVRRIDLRLSSNDLPKWFQLRFFFSTLFQLFNFQLFCFKFSASMKLLDKVEIGVSFKLVGVHFAHVSISSRKCSKKKNTQHHYSPVKWLWADHLIHLHLAENPMDLHPT